MEFKYVPTTCPYCGTGCGFNLVVKDKKVVGVQPWQRNPVNEGKLCPKGNYAWEFINSPERLTKPLIKKDGKFVRITNSGIIESHPHDVSITRESPNYSRKSLE